MKIILTLLITLALASVSFAGPNLIINGDFEAGNESFLTQYIYVPPPGYLHPAQRYTVYTNPQLVHGAFTSYGDHTTGTGNMLIVNAATAADQTVWQQTLPVVPNANYVFTYYLRLCYPSAPPLLHCSINGTEIGTSPSGLTTGAWSQVSHTWNSGDSTTATIRLVDSVCAYTGDDFAIDDISFCSTVIEVAIDIKPVSWPNAINLGLSGVIPVAILTTPEFDAATVDPAQVYLDGLGVAVRGRSDKLLASLEDVDGDGDLDLVVKIDTQNLEPGYWQDGPVVLTGKTYDGQDIRGQDDIIIVPPK